MTHNIKMQNNTCKSLPLVSVVSPCYNVAPYIGRFLDSLINQTYKHLEIILVNDGSTDNTGHIIESYIPKLQKEGYIVRYIVQNNQGLAASINNGIKHVTGVYFTWPDPDDWLTPRSVERRVQFLEENQQVALVRCNVEKVEDGTQVSLGYCEPPTHPSAPIANFFEKLVYTQTWYGALACMVRMRALDQVIPDREIYVAKRSGQNYQLLLPIARVYECWQLSEVLAFYTIRKDSHSHKIHDYDRQIDLLNDFMNALLYTLSRIDDLDAKYSKWAYQKYKEEALSWAKHHRKLVDIWRFSKELITCTPSIKNKLKLLTTALYHCLIKPLIFK